MNQNICINNNLKKIFLVNPRGYCAGVQRAILSVEKALEKYGAPIYVRRQIVHNAYIVNILQKRGVKFVNCLSEIPKKNHVIFSAHGVSPEIFQQARLRQLKIIDATCPLVTKVHKEVVRFSKQNFEILLIGHANHEEVQGTLGEAPNHIKIISNINDAHNVKVNNPKKLVWLSQTTLNIKKTLEIVKILKQRFLSIKGPPSSDICYATFNRQNAVRNLVKYVDLILIVGSSNSSNSIRLLEVALENGMKNAYRIENAEQIQNFWLKNIKKIGITAGASAPEKLVNDVVLKLKKEFNFSNNVCELFTNEEKLTFSLPRNI